MVAPFSAPDNRTVAVYRTLDELPARYRAWLEHYYTKSFDTGRTAVAFGVTESAVAYIVNCPAGQQYALRLVGGSRAAINLHCAHLLLQRLAVSGGKIPTETLVKLFSASLPKETPLGQVEEKVEMARRLARESNLNEEDTARVVHFAMTGS